MGVDDRRMPEGHVLHRQARLQRKRFLGEAVHTSSPQGRFETGAARLDGQTVAEIRAIGKHLLYRFETDDHLHIHLGLFGKFRLRRQPAPDPSPNCRLLLWTDDDELHLAGPTACEVLEPEEVAALEARLGPDPIARPADGAEKFAKRLSTRSIPIGKALLDQKVIAGLGNVYRAELLFMLGIHPFVPSKEVMPHEVEALWDLSVIELVEGERAGKIVTVDPSELGKSRRSDLKRGEKLYAYKRHGRPCRRCGSEIVAADIDGRNIWWCPSCQPAR